MKKARTLAVLAGSTAVAVSAGFAAASTTFSLGTLNVNDSISSIDLSGGTVAAGTYTGFEVSFDWVAGVGGPWSTEAVWALTDDSAAAALASVFYADPGSSPDAMTNGDPVTLNWAGSFQTQNVETGVTGSNYMGGDSLWFNAVQTFAGSDATWNNVSVKLTTDPVSFDSTFCGGFASGTTATGNSWDRPIGAGPSISGLGPVEYAVVEFFVDTTGTYDIASITPDHDGYLHIYEGSFDPNDQLTNLIGGDDDGAILGLGSSVVEGLSLSTGTSYFAVVSGFELGEAGAFTLNSLGDGKAFVPAPASAAFLAMGGLVASRRRR